MLKIVLFCFLIDNLCILYSVYYPFMISWFNGQWYYLLPILFYIFFQACGILFITQMICWTPYAILVLWTVVFPPSSLNLYYTLIPPLVCKVSFSESLLCKNNIFFYSKEIKGYTMCTPLFTFFSISLGRFVECSPEIVKIKKIQCKRDYNLFCGY